MKMEEQKSICLSGRPMHFLLSSVPGKNGCSAFPHPVNSPEEERKKILSRRKSGVSKGRKPVQRKVGKGEYWLTCRGAETSQTRGDAVRFFRFIGEKQRNKGNGRFPLFTAGCGGKRRKHMKKDLKRQIITALAVTAVLGAAGGMTAQAAFDKDHILAKQDTIKENGYGVNAGSSYWYGVVGGKAYADSKTTIYDDFEGTKVVDGGIKGTVSNINGIVSQVGIYVGLDDSLIDAVDNVDNILKRTENANAGKDTTIGGDAGLSTAIAEDTNPSVVRFYGAVGGDLSLNTGLRANGEDGGLNLFLGTAKTPLLRETSDTSIVRNGDIVNNLGGKDEEGNILSGGSFIGGVGGSAAAALGNITVEGSYSKSSATVSADLKLDGKTSATVNGNVVTNVAKDTNVIGWMNGGLAAGIGGTASSTVTGDTTLTIDGTKRTVRTKDFEKPGDEDMIPQLTTALNVMEGSGISAIGVMGGGTAVSTLGGTATANVTGTSTVNIKNATVLGTIGGGLAASVDATGAAEAVLFPNKQIGNDDGTSGFGINNGENGLEIVTGADEENATIKVGITNVNEGGTATSTTGDTYVNLTGSSTAVGVLGGGAAVASHTYTYKGDETDWVDGQKPDNGYTTNDEFGSSTATAETGRSHITVALTKDAGFDGEANGWEVKSGMLNAVKSFVNKVVNDTGDLQADELEALHNKGVAVGVFGGGAAIAQSGNQQFINNAEGTLSKTDGAFATAETAGSDIELASGYIAGVMGGGIAAVDNNAAASSNMDGTVNITIGGYVDEEGNELDPEVIGVFGNGLAYFTGSSNGGQNELKGQAVASAKDTNILVRGGSVDGIYGGGMAIDDSQADVTNAKAETNGTVNITVTGGTVNATNLSVLQGVPYVNGISGAAGNAAIVAGGIALGGGAEADVKDAVVNINGGTVNGDIYGGGIAAYGYSVTEMSGEEQQVKPVGGSHVNTSTINLTGGEVKGNVYAGGAASSKELPDHEGYTYAIATVDKAVINLAGTTVDGILYGTGTIDGAANGTSETASSTVKESTLNVIGTNKLGLKEGASKIQDFTNVNFTAGSETVVTDANDTTALIDGGKVTVDGSAKLNVAAIDDKNGNYKIAANASEGSTFWDKDNLIYDRMNGHYITSTGVTGEDGSYDVTVKEIGTDTKLADDAADSMTNALGVKDLRGMFREGMNDGWKKLDKNSGTYSYLNDWQLAENKTPYQKGMLFGEDAAVTGNTVSIARAMADNVTQRLSFTDDYVQEQGWANQDGGVWAKYMHRKYETDGMSSSVGGIRSGTDYDGILVGMDLAKNGKFQSGVAIHYGSGEGDGLISHNDYDAWGITLYGGLKDEEAGTNLMADIGWMTSDNDIDGTVNGTRMSADRDVDAWTIGIRGEKEFVSGKNQIVPYAGLRYMSVNPGSYTTYYGGKEAFHNDAENQDLWLLPIGVSFRNETVTNSGWRITPKVDLSYIWAFGDTDTDMTVNAGGYTGNLYYDVMDDSSWLATLGVEAEKDAWTFGVNYGYQKGDDTKNKTWYVTAGYSF